MSETSDRKQNIDLEQEIQQLDEFLNAQEEEFPLDDGGEDVLAASPRQEKTKGGVGKYIAYLLILLLLCGGGYGVYMYAPMLMQNPDLQHFQAMMKDRSQSQPQTIIPEPTAIATPEAVESTPNNGVSGVHSDNEIEALPVPSDEPVLALDTTNDIANLAGNGFGDDVAVNDVPEEIVQPEPEEVATTIAQALEITQSATNETITDVANPDNVYVEAEDTAVIEGKALAEETAQSDDVDVVEVKAQEVDSSIALERIPAGPMFKGKGNVSPLSVGRDDLPPLSEEKVDTANGIMDMGADELIESVETADVVEVAEETVETIKLPEVEIVVDEAKAKIEKIDVVLPEQEVQAVVEVVNQDVLEKEKLAVESVNEIVAVKEDIQEQVIEEPVAVSQIPTAPIEVVVKKAEPVKQKTPVRAQKPIISNRPAIKRDPRVTQAKAALDQNDYAQAVNLYQSVLVSNPADTHALTGLQLAKAKMRMAGVTQQQSPSVSAPIPSAPTPVVAVDDTSVQGLLQMASANPRDALIAVKLANAYRGANDKVKAMEWYRKALQLDVIYSSGIDRMAIYDAMASLAQ